MSEMPNKSLLLSKKPFPEYYNEPINDSCIQKLSKPVKIKAGKKRKKGEEDTFAEITSDNKLKTKYYVGVNWIIKNELAIYVIPKIDGDTQKTDYLKMLWESLKYSKTEGLYKIKFNEPFIEIEHEQDLITPLLIIHFLHLLQIIVRKGLKKSHYKITRNLNGKIKGKLMVSQTLKQHLSKNKQLENVCQYGEFGINSVENKILKKTLIAVRKYLALHPLNTNNVNNIISIVGYCQSAFQEVDDEYVNLRELKNIKPNSFFKEYKEALHIASLILRRFQYNLKEIDKKGVVKVPPFWINMNRLFELYVLSLLKGKDKDKDKYDIEYQFKCNSGNPDFIRVSKDYNELMIIDAKYKKIYWGDKCDTKDIRQLSGYARDIKILELLEELKYITPEKRENKVIDCLIIYPAQNTDSSNPAGKDICIEKKQKIPEFTRFFKLAVKLPVIRT